MNPLELKDIHLPEASLWWPPAPGWWLLLGLLLAIVMLLRWAIRRIRHKPLKRLCLQELQGIRDNLASGQSRKTVLADTTALLRRTLLAYHGRAGFAATTGDDWLQQLQDLAQGFDEVQLELLGRGRYQREFECDIEGLLQACERWIRALPRVSHVSA
jgi:mannitol-1-phosphate/altronate dehydrogenase